MRRQDRQTQMKVLVKKTYMLTTFGRLTLNRSLVTSESSLVPRHLPCNEYQAALLESKKKRPGDEASSSRNVYHINKKYS